MNEVVAWNSTGPAVGIALAHAGVQPVWLGMRKSVGTTRTAVGSRRLALGTTMRVNSQEGFRRWELPRHQLPLPLLFILLFNLVLSDGETVKGMNEDQYSSDYTSRRTHQLCQKFSIAADTGASISNHDGCNMRFVSMKGHKSTTSSLTVRFNLAAKSSCWQANWRGDEEGCGKKKIIVDYFRVGNSTWSHAVGAPMDLGEKIALVFLKRPAHLGTYALMTY
jgi:hypothetical protein